MRISDLPPELRANIVAFACSQIPSALELPTSLALSLVSSQWNSFCRPFRYHSLRVSGATAISRLIARLEAVSERERRVRYLALSDLPLEATSDTDILYRQRSLIARLLALLTPSLFVLELHLASPAFATSLFAVLWELPAPYLDSLSVKGYYPFPTACAKQLIPELVSNFPCLRHLALDGVANPAGLLSSNALERAFPMLTELEIRGLRGALAFAREVAQAVGERDELLKATVTVPVPYTSRLPRTLKSLSLFPSVDPSNMHSKRGRTLHAEMLGTLVRLAARGESEGRPIVRVVSDGPIGYDDMPISVQPVSRTGCGHVPSQIEVAA